MVAVAVVVAVMVVVAVAMVAVAVASFGGLPSPNQNLARQVHRWAGRDVPVLRTASYCVRPDEPAGARHFMAHGRLPPIPVTRYPGEGRVD